ncbi:MAG: cyclase family protein [Caldilineales bacterium]
MTWHDITLSITPALPVWPGDPPVTLSQPAQLAHGDAYTLTRLDISAHTGTHLDAPAHFIADGVGIEALDLARLIGPAQVIDARGHAQISAAVLATLPLAPAVQRVLFLTDNSARWDIPDHPFANDFVAIEADAAQALVDRGVQLVGIDYLSVAPYHDPVPTHQILLGAGVIPVEGLDLRGITPGFYQLICLPMKIIGADGAPCRAVLLST